MSNQDLIDYLLSVQSSNSDQITGLQNAITSLNANIDNLNEQIATYNDQISTLIQNNEDINLIIAFIPPDEHSIMPLTSNIIKKDK